MAAPGLDPGAADTTGSAMDDFDRALAQAQGWLDRDGVVGVGEGEEDGERAVVVWILPDADVDLPERLDGVPVAVRETGELRALD